jgi:DNA polymerase III subunit gamma/tau
VTGTLATRYRPRRFSEVAGQTPSVAVLYRMAALGNIPDAMIFSGCHGSGKTTSARILAAALNCEAGPGPADRWPCLECANCKATAGGASLDVIEVDAASNGGVAEIRKIREMVQYASTAAYQVVLLDEAQSMSRDAFNALLKVLEEPPPGTVFILLTTEPGKIIPPVKSRCMSFPFSQIPPQVIAARLAWICQQENQQVESELLAAIAEQAGGAMRDAVMSLDQVIRVGITDLARWRILSGVSDFAPGLVESMASGDHAQLFSRLEEVLLVNADYALISARVVACLRDILILRAGGMPAVQGTSLMLRQALARSIDEQRAAAAMRVLWDLRTRAPRIEPRSSLELALVMCSERLALPKTTQVVTQMSSAPQPGNYVMSLAELQAATGGRR